MTKGIKNIVASKWMFFLLSICHLNCENPKEEQSDNLPNIVLILADDLGYGDLEVYNSDSKIPTPNLNSLAENGLRFTDAHSPSSVCSPTRYGILTGQYAWRTQLKKGVLWAWDKPLIASDRVTIPKILSEKGYQTACIGKWHLGFGEKDTERNTVIYTLPIGNFQ